MAKELKKVDEKEKKGLKIYDPFKEFSLMRAELDAFDDFFNTSSFFGTPMLKEKEFEPKIEIKETDKEFIIKASVPGMEQKDINVEFSDGMLTIKGEKNEQKEEKDKKGNYIRRESSYGSFLRSFNLPSNAKDENMKTAYKNGILNITVPKTGEKKHKGIAIEIK